jgi:hypothetical protein
MLAWYRPCAVMYSRAEATGPSSRNVLRTSGAGSAAGLIIRAVQSAGCSSPASTTEGSLQADVRPSVPVTRTRTVR